MIKVALLSLLLMLSLAVAAGSDDSVLDRIYVADRQALEISRDRQLTLGRNITSVLPSPAGTRIAFLSQHEDGDDITTTLSTIGLVKNETRDYLSENMLGGDGSAIVSFIGWSADSRYLAYVTSSTDQAQGVFSTDVGVIDLATGESTLLSNILGSSVHSWSFNWGSGDRLAVAAQGPNGWALDVYDVAKAQLSDWPRLDSEPNVVGWTDSSHVLFYDSGTKKRLLIDTSTGSVSPLASKPAFVDMAVTAEITHLAVPGGSAKIGLSLDARVFPAVASDGTPHKQNTDTVWVDVHGLLPLNKSRSPDGHMVVDSFLDGTDEAPVSAQFLPQSSHDTSTRIVLLAHGNLYLSTVHFDNASTQEALDAGDEVPCPEEMLLAASDLKMIGLGMIQYAQDYDNTLPPAASFHDAISPYIKDDSVFDVDDHHFNFQLDGQETGSFGDNTTVSAGNMILPCGKIVLFLDGHVEGIPFQRSSGLSKSVHGRGHQNLTWPGSAGCGCGA